MENWQSEFLELEKQVSWLINKLQESNEENKRLKEQLSFKEGELKDFQNQHKISKLVGSINPEGEDAEMLKSRIDENIQLIDKCIAQLSRSE